MYDTKLSWGTSPSRTKPSAAQRRQEALTALRWNSADRLRSKSDHDLLLRKSRGRPRKLGWLEERKVATFIALRVLEKRILKNALTDACEKFVLSRATVFRIRAKHKVGAKYMAQAIFRARNRTFRSVIEVKHRILPIDFSDWGSDRY